MKPYKTEWESGIDEGFKRICETVLPEIDIQIEEHEEMNNTSALNSLYHIRGLIENMIKNNKRVSCPRCGEEAEHPYDHPQATRSGKTMYVCRLCGYSFWEYKNNKRVSCTGCGSEEVVTMGHEDYPWGTIWNYECDNCGKDFWV